MAAKQTVVTVVAGMAALGAGLGVAGLASADPTATPSASPSSSAGSGTTAPDGERRGGDFGRHGHAFGADAAALAEKLGVTEAKVREALEAVRAENQPSEKPTPGTERPDPAERAAELAKQLADKLGLDEAKVTAALDELRTERRSERAAALQDRLDAAVKAGTLTQAEAEAVTKAVAKGVIHAGGR